MEMPALTLTGWQGGGEGESRPQYWMPPWPAWHGWRGSTRLVWRWQWTTATTAMEAGGARLVPPAAMASPASIVRRWQHWHWWRRKRGGGAVDSNGNPASNSNGGPVAHSNRKDGNKSAAPCTGRMTMMTAATATGGDRDHSAQGNLDHCNNSTSDCYQSGGSGKTWGGSSGSGGSRGGGNSNRIKWRRRKYEGRGESTPVTVDFASRRGQLASNMFRLRRKMERNLFFDG
jgi:hypothetical protein